MKREIAILVVSNVIVGFIAFSILPIVTALFFAVLGAPYEELAINSPFGPVTFELSYDHVSSVGSSGKSHLQSYYPLLDLVYAVFFGFVMTFISLWILRPQKIEKT